MSQYFRILAAAINIYSFICFVRIILTWFPRAKFSSAGRILAAVTDPYLNLFRRLRFLNFNGIDFSPAAALCVLFGIATVLSSLGSGHELTVGFFLAVFVGIIWALFSSIFKFIIAVLILRLIIYAVMRIISRKNGYQPYSPFWDQADRIISPFIYKISGIFVKKFIPFTTALIISIVLSIIAVKLADFGVSLLCSLLSRLPF